MNIPQTVGNYRSPLNEGFRLFSAEIMIGHWLAAFEGSYQQR